jgi:hypothetical protein
MSVIRANVPELLTVDLDHVLFETLGTFKYEELLNAVYQVKSSDKQLEYGLTVGGFPLLAEKDENVSLASRDWAEGYKTTYTHKTFGIYTAISMEAQQDELHGITDKLPAAMARSVDATINYYASRTFSRATSTSEDFVTGGDAVALLATNHPLRGGGTSSNTPSTAADLTATSLWAGINAFYQMLDDQSKPIRNAPSTILIPHQSEQKVIELLMSDLYPENAENAVNAIQKRKGQKLSYVVWPYWIGSVDSDCWFILGDKAGWGKDYPAKWYWRMKPETESDNDFFTKEFLYSVVTRFSCGFTDWRWIYGSMGA